MLDLRKLVWSDITWFDYSGNLKKEIVSKPKFVYEPQNEQEFFVVDL